MSIKNLKIDLERAFSLHREGRFVDAIDEYNKLLEKTPNNFSVMHMLGVAYMQIGDLEKSELFLNQAIHLNKKSPELRLNRIRLFERLGDYQSALDELEFLLTHQPNDADLLFKKGSFERKLNKDRQASESFKKALYFRPSFYQASYNLGNSLVTLGDHEGAIRAYLSCLEIEPNHLEAAFNLGTILMQCKRFFEAISVFERILKNNPGHIDSLINKGNALRELKHLEDAATNFREAIRLAPQRVEAYNNLASTLADLKDFDKAIATFDAGLNQYPNSLLLLNGKASVLKRQGKIQHAINVYDTSISNFPNDIEARTARSLCLLLNGRLQEGFKEYEWRWKSSDLADIIPSFNVPLWLGDFDISKKKLAIRWEQGLGDTIQFFRYALILIQQGIDVLVIVQSPLYKLLSQFKGRGEIFFEGQPLPRFDHYIPMLSLPLAMGTKLGSIPSSTSYIKPDQKSFTFWTQRLGKKRAHRIGLAWSGRAEHKNDQNRSIRLEFFVNGLQPHFEYYCLQKDLRAQDLAFLKKCSNIHFFGSQIDDFSDTASICAQMDLVISVDTSVAHLAGALGKQVWVLLPYIPDWRWLLDREDSPWYPTARLFRQPSPGEWTPVLEKIKKELLSEF